MTPGEARAALSIAFDAAIVAIEPRALVRDRLNAERDDGIGSLRCGVVAIGKAAAAMTWGAHDALSGSLVSGVAVGASDMDVPNGIDWHTGNHPIPGDRSVAAGMAVLNYLDTADVDFIVFLISGGGSALIEVPPPGFSIEQIAAIQSEALASDIPIDQLNLVRRSMSMVKNGGLLRATRSPSATFLISDVGDGDASVVASGPTIASSHDPASAVRILTSAGIALDADLEAWMRTPQPVTKETRWAMLADGWTAARAAADNLAALGEPVTMPRRPFRGEARRVGPAMVGQAQTGFTVAPGETTVTVTGGGLGGRNTEAALATALVIEGRDDLVFGAFATDGVDGPTEAAGAIVDGGTTARIRAAELDPVLALDRNDSYSALEAAGDVVVTGPTGTNVADLWIAWAGGHIN